mmetsp:Transcript_2736/g.6601  ORF Transcript_2736/g.6601 Transcript_2736/m.6601 type:complete len:570 (+) Transcript_2736:81-1790(+)
MALASSSTFPSRSCSRTRSVRCTLLSCSTSTRASRAASPWRAASRVRAVSPLRSCCASACSESARRLSFSSRSHAMSVSFCRRCARLRSAAACCRDVWFKSASSRACRFRPSTCSCAERSAASARVLAPVCIISCLFASAAETTARRLCSASRAATAVISSFSNSNDWSSSAKRSTLDCVGVACGVASASHATATSARIAVTSSRAANAASSADLLAASSCCTKLSMSCSRASSSPLPSASPLPPPPSVSGFAAMPLAMPATRCNTPSISSVVVDLSQPAARRGRECPPRPSLSLPCVLACACAAAHGVTTSASNTRVRLNGVPPAATASACATSDASASAYSVSALHASRASSGSTAGFGRTDGGGAEAVCAQSKCVTCTPRSALWTAAVSAAFAVRTLSPVPGEHAASDEAGMGESVANASKAQSRSAASSVTMSTIMAACSSMDKASCPASSWSYPSPSSYPPSYLPSPPRSIPSLSARPPHRAARRSARITLASATVLSFVCFRAMTSSAIPLSMSPRDWLVAASCARLSLLVATCRESASSTARSATASAASASSVSRGICDCS